MPKSSLIHEPIPRFDHLVLRLLSIVLDGTLPSLPLAMTLAIARLVQVLAAVVVNDHDLGNVIALPARSFTPVVIVAICLVEKAKFEDGLKLAVLPSELRDTIPTTFLVVAGVVVVFSLFNVKVVAVIVELFTGSLNVAVIDALTGTAVVPLVGFVSTTVGGVVSALPLLP